MTKTSKTMRGILAAAALGLGLLAFYDAESAGAGPAAAPKLHITQSKELPTPLPLPYDEKANASADVDAAFARARVSGKRVLIDLGGNWCPDCRILSGVMDLPEVKPFMAQHFETVAVDVGRFDRNLHIPERFKVGKVGGVPWLIIAEPDGTVIHSSYEVTDNGFSEKPQAMVNWLAKWAN
jgi:thiol-disulfide isomerase/thioredoxin